MMNAWNSIVIIVSTILLVMLLRKEILRYNKARFFLRITASVITVICIACMAIPITIQKQNEISHNEIIVFTKGANLDSIYAFQKNKHIPVFSEDDFLMDPSVIYDSVHVLGYGFSPDDLKEMNQNFVFHFSPVNAGITEASWNRKLKKGEELLVQGSYTNHSGSPVTLLLTGFNSVLDTFVALSKQSIAFRLQTVPKQNGKAVYSLVAQRGKDTLENEPIPVEVIPSSPVKVMILSGSPDFENKFLKDWLSQNGYTVVNKIMISTNKSEKSFFNTNTISLDKITPSILDSFDIVLSDETALSTLSKPEQENLYRQVNNAGLGLIIRGDTIANANTWYTRPFSLYKVSGAQSSKLTVSLSNAPHFKAQLTAEEPLFIKLQWDMQALATDSAGNMLTAITTDGAGKIIFTTISNTYNWLLSGNQKDYYTFWNRLLQKAAKPHVSSSIIETIPSLPVSGQPIRFVVQNKQESTPMMRIDNIAPAFIQNPQLPNQWETVYWPSHPGWQSPVILGETEYNWYVYDKNDWPYISARKRIEAGEHYSRQNNLENEPNAPKTATVPLSLVYFFLPFIICCAFLWAERKIS